MSHPAMVAGAVWLKEILSDNEISEQYLSRESKLIWWKYKDKTKEFFISVLGDNENNFGYSNELEFESDKNVLFTIIKKPDVKVDIGKVTVPGIHLPLVLERHEWKVDLHKFINYYSLN